MTTTSRRALLAGAAALATGATVPVANAATPDPIFSLIEQYGLAYAHWSRVLDLGNEAEAEEDDAYEAKRDLEIALARTRPTTLAGILAIMRYEREFRDQPDELSYDIFDFESGEEPERGTIRGWLATIEKSIAAIAPPAVRGMNRR